MKKFVHLKKKKERKWTFDARTHLKLEPEVLVGSAVSQSAPQLATPHYDADEALQTLHALQEPLQSHLALLRWGYNPDYHWYQFPKKKKISRLQLWRQSSTLATYSLERTFVLKSLSRLLGWQHWVILGSWSKKLSFNFYQ